MKANPGGQIDLAEVVGRDQLIGRIWDTLDQQSIRMNAERRIGKTTIIRKVRRAKARLGAHISGPEALPQRAGIRAVGLPRGGRHRSWPPV